MLSPAQNAFYWRLWAMLRKRKPGADRHAEHLALGLPQSHTEWNPKVHFDRWKDHCLGEAEAKLPEDGEARRKMVFIGHLLSATEQGEAELEALVSRMNRGGKWGGKFRTAGTLTGAQLQGVMIALKKECKRRWPTKDDLLDEIRSLRPRLDLEAAAETDAVMEALNWRGAPAAAPTPDTLPYEDLLVWLSVLRRLGGHEAIFQAPEVHGVGSSHGLDCPF